MIHTLKEILENSDREFEEKFKVPSDTTNSGFAVNADIEVIKSHIHEDRKKLLMAVVERVEEMMKEDMHEKLFSHRNGYCKCTYNQALSDLSSLLQDLIK